MTIKFYFIPMTDPPYSRVNPQRPEYLDLITCNWSGYPLFWWDYYICQVNTGSGKHSALESQPGVEMFPEGSLPDVVGDMGPVHNATVQRVLNAAGIPYYADETVKQVIERIIVSSELELGMEDRDTLIGDLPQHSQDKIVYYKSKHALENIIDEPLRDFIHRFAVICWRPDRTFVGEF